MPSFRSSASFGKRQEFAAIAELLKRNYDVHLTLVVDQPTTLPSRFNKLSSRKHELQQYVSLRRRASQCRDFNRRLVWHCEKLYDAVLKRPCGRGGSASCVD
jgi:hypothetical protein